jgi:hypothetical protein
VKVTADIECAGNPVTANPTRCEVRNADEVASPNTHGWIESHALSRGENVEWASLIHEVRKSGLQIDWTIGAEQLYLRRTEARSA